MAKLMPLGARTLRRLDLKFAKRYPSTKGICRQCGCTENNACTGLGFLEDETCSWANKERTLCTNPRCLSKSASKAPASNIQLVPSRKAGKAEV